jgi:hypothetical protein
MKHYKKLMVKVVQDEGQNLTNAACLEKLIGKLGQRELR